MAQDAARLCREGSNHTSAYGCVCAGGHAPQEQGACMGKGVGAAGGMDSWREGRKGMSRVRAGSEVKGVEGEWGARDGVNRKQGG